MRSGWRGRSRFAIRGHRGTSGHAQSSASLKNCARRTTRPRCERVASLHAQTKPPAYNIAEIAIKDQDGYNKEYLPLITKALTDAGGKFVGRGGKTISFEGASPAPRVVVIQFENLEKLQALYESAPYKQAVAIGDKYATQRIFGVEGVLP